MVIDSSAALAVLLQEKEAEVFKALETNDAKSISAASYQEVMIVLERSRGALGEEDFHRFLRAVNCTVIPFDRKQAEYAV